MESSYWKARPQLLSSTPVKMGFCSALPAVAQSGGNYFVPLFGGRNPQVAPPCPQTIISSGVKMIIFCNSAALFIKELKYLASSSLQCLAALLWGGQACFCFPCAGNPEPCRGCIGYPLGLHWINVSVGKESEDLPPSSSSSLNSFLWVADGIFSLSWEAFWGRPCAIFFSSKWLVWEE